MKALIKGPLSAVPPLFGPGTHPLDRTYSMAYLLTPRKSLCLGSYPEKDLLSLSPGGLGRGFHTDLPERIFQPGDPHLSTFTSQSFLVFSKGKSPEPNAN